jgi:hypothetical protein
LLCNHLPAHAEHAVLQGSGPSRSGWTSKLPVEKQPFWHAYEILYEILYELQA